MVYFSWSVPWNIPHFCWEQGRIYLFFSNASEIKAGAEDSLDILEDFLFILSVSLTLWMSLFGDSLCDSGSSDGVRGMDTFFTTIIQEGGKNLCTLRSAGNQQLHDLLLLWGLPTCNWWKWLVRGARHLCLQSHRAIWLNSHKSWLDTKWQC